MFVCMYIYIYIYRERESRRYLPLSEKLYAALEPLSLLTNTPKSYITVPVTLVISTLDVMYIYTYVYI